jgi:hypothetical protein
MEPQLGFAQHCTRERNKTPVLKVYFKIRVIGYPRWLPTSILDFERMLLIGNGSTDFHEFWQTAAEKHFSSSGVVECMSHIWKSNMAQCKK